MTIWLSWTICVTSSKIIAPTRWHHCCWKAYLSCWVDHQLLSQRVRVSTTSYGNLRFDCSPCWVFHSSCFKLFYCVWGRLVLITRLSKLLVRESPHVIHMQPSWWGTKVSNWCVILGDWHWNLPSHGWWKPHLTVCVCVSVEITWWVTVYIDCVSHWQQCSISALWGTSWMWRQIRVTSWYSR